MSLSDLSFVQPDNSGDFPKLLLWEPQRTDDYGRDTAHGGRCYEELAAKMAEDGNPTLLLRVMEAQVLGGVWAGPEIGFAQRMAEAVIAAAYVSGSMTR